MTLSLYLNKLPMKTITFILSILFSATVFSQSLVEKSFPKEELFSLGSYYYPEQWDSSQWERDLKKMSDMGIKFTHFAEFSWSMMEPEEGRYNFEWLDRAGQVIYLLLLIRLMFVGLYGTAWLLSLFLFFSSFGLMALSG